MGTPAPLATVLICFSVPCRPGTTCYFWVGRDIRSKIFRSICIRYRMKVGLSDVSERYLCSRWQQIPFVSRFYLTVVFLWLRIIVFLHPEQQFSFDSQFR